MLEEPDWIVNIRRWIEYLKRNPVKGVFALVVLILLTLWLSGKITEKDFDCIFDPMLCSMDDKME